MIIHPAHQMSFDKLYEGLCREVEAGYINRKFNGELELFDYNRSAMFEKRWNDFTLIARGLILCLSEKRIVATPFPKFFNYGEVSQKLPDLPFEATTKYDGSMGICYYYNKRWQVATRGSFESEQAKWATNFINSKEWLSHFNINNTYLVEIIYPENRIVTDYKGWSGIVMLAAFDNKGNEISVDSMTIPWDSSKGICGRTRYPMIRSIQRLLDLAKTEPDHNKEGWVVRYDNGYRIKIKTDQYCRVHKLISRVTPLAIWEAMVAGDNLDQIRLDLPEEFHKDFDRIKFLLQSTLDSIYNGELKNFEYIKSKTKDRKEFALAVQERKDEIFDPSIQFAFYNEAKPEVIKSVILKKLRPTANNLPGYVASTSMNRFAEQES